MDSMRIEIEQALDRDAVVPFKPPGQNIGDQDSAGDRSKPIH
jgi:hypothetical protein